MKHFKLLTIIAAISAVSCSENIHYRRIEGFAQGGTYHIIYSEPQAADGTAPASEDSVLKVISDALKDIDFSISGYNKGSLLSKFNRGEECVPDKYFTEVFELSKIIYEQTDGLFDVSGGPLFDLWGFGFSSPELFDSLKVNKAMAQKVDSLLKFTGMDKIRLENGVLVRDNPQVKLNFNAIAQGYTCDVLARLLEDFGVKNYLVEVGMEIVCKGVNASGNKWRIAIDAPIDGSQIAGEAVQDILDVTDCAIVTSGNYRKFHIIDGEKYSHSINPRTGYPSRHDLLSATVIVDVPARRNNEGNNANQGDSPNTADTAATCNGSTENKYAPENFPGAYCDAFATYCMVIGKESSESFILSRPDLRGYLIFNGGTIKLID